jgi:hypothetical protein
MFSCHDKAAVDVALTLQLQLLTISRRELDRLLVPEAPVVSLMRRRYRAATTGGSGPTSAT